jgi:hypothetical protein
MDFDHAVRLLGLLGGLAGAITLIWRLIDVFKAYLHIELTVESLERNRVKLRTVVENTNTIAGRLDAAFLVIGPGAEDADEIARTLFSKSDSRQKLTNLDEMVRAITDRIKHDDSPMEDGAGRKIVPLPYYFVENYDVADERLSYEEILDCSSMAPGTYAARFYIEASPRLHRVVHGAFEVR